MAGAHHARGPIRRCLELSDARRDPARLAGEDHRTAADKLRKLCSTNKLDGGGIKHFAWLIQHKTPIAYGDEPIDDNKVKIARDKALQFHAWVYRTFPALARSEGGEPS